MPEKEQPVEAVPVISTQTDETRTNDSPDSSDELDCMTTNYLKGWPLYVAITALSLAVFLANLEVSIVSTSLVAITDRLQGFGQSSWIVTAYMLTYTGWLIILAKLSDIFGRKLLIVVSLCIFVVFSAACGAAQTMTQLIAFRAIQGIGGAGTYSMVFVIFFEMIPPEKFAPYSAMLTGVFALSLLAGPLFGGVINTHASWRWVFLLNVPAGVVAIVLLLVTIPAKFPYHGLPELHQPPSLRRSFTRAQLRRVDYLGTVFLLLATVLLVTALEEAGSRYRWNAAFIIIILVVSGFSWIACLVWSYRLSLIKGVQESVLPWRFLRSRVTVGLLGSMFLTGAPFTVAVIQIPLKFQAVHGLSPLAAGIRLLPFGVLSPVGSAVGAAIASKAKIPPVFLVAVGSAIQIVGFTLLSISSTSQIPGKAQYGYEAIAGFSLGINLACLTLLVPFVVEKRDKSVAMSAVIQFRMMGGAIGLAIVTTVMNSYVRSHLAEHLSPAQIEALLKTAEAFTTLPPNLADIARNVFAKGYNLQMSVMIGFSAAQIPVSLLIWQKNQVVI